MDSLFGGLKNLLKAKNVTLDDMLFRLHYRITFVILLAASLMVTAKSYFGDPIDCITKDDIPPKLLQTYCWIESTFSMEKAWKKRIDIDVPYPGIEKQTPNEKRVYHAYYQWVCFVLFFQALLFYVPRALWKNFEGGRIRSMVTGLDNPKNKDSARTKLVRYLHESIYSHRSFFWVYIFLEVLNFLNVILQMFIMDEFLGNEFSQYGLQVLKFTEWDWSIRYDPMLKVFPRLTKCTFRRFGSSGDVQKHDAMCILPINILNEKIYIFLWFWFYFLAFVTLLGLVYRVVILVSARVRYIATYSRRPIKDLEARRAFEYIVNTCGSGTWFFIDLLSRNMDSKNFRDVVLDFYKNFD